MAAPSPSLESTFGALLRRFRCASGLSQEALAERARLSAGAVSTLERSTRRGPQRKTLLLLADALGLTAAERAEFEAAATLGRARPVRTGERISAASVPNNLPHTLTSFHGRGASLATIARALQSRRLVTLIGGGGVGKTRLAIEAARELARGAMFPDGIVLVRLAPLRLPELVETAIARELHVREIPNVPLLDTLVEAVGAQRMLVILDNCEHLLGASGRVAERLLRDCGNVVVLTTTREALDLDGECAVRVDPLPADGPGLALFADRLADADWQRYARLGEDERASAATICARLDGIPLALELAAARARDLSLDEIVRGLDDRFALIDRAPGNPPSQRPTLRGTIDWSFALLTPAEGALLGPLGLFASPFAAATARAVCGQEDGPARAALDGLVAKSLVTVVERTGGTRYRVHETIRAYALEQLDARGERDRYALRFARHFLALARDADARYGRTSHETFLASVEPELENFRFALEWTLGAGHDPGLGAELAGALGWCFRQLSLFSEGVYWCRKALDEAGALPPDVAGRLQMALSFFAFNAGELRNALVAAQAATTAYREAGGLANVAWARTQEAYCYYMLGRVDDAATAARDAVAIARAAGDVFRLGGALNALAPTIPIERAPERLALLEEAVRCFLAAGDPHAIVPLANLAEALFAAGCFEEAFGRALEIVTITRAGGDRSNLASALTNLAGYALMVDDLEGAERAGREALDLVRTLGKSLNVMCALQHLGGVWARRGDHARAALLCGASNRLYDEFGLGREFTERSLYDRTIAILRGNLTENALARELRAGAAWSTERAIDEALQLSP